MNEEAIKNYLEQNEQRLQKLEDEMLGIPGNSKQPEKDEKETEIDDFIGQMKAINTAPKSEADEGGDDENEFINLMQNINK